MVGLAAELDVALVDDALALVTHVFVEARGTLPLVAVATQCAASVAQKTRVGQNAATRLATEAVGMPAVVHGLDDAADDELAAFSTAWGE